MEFRTKTTGEIIEAVQVPIQKEHEAAKDLEQRYAKVCGWLIDRNNVANVDFSVVNESITIIMAEGFHPSVRTFWPGAWLMENRIYGVVVTGESYLVENFEEV